MAFPRLRPIPDGPGGGEVSSTALRLNGHAGAGGVCAAQRSSGTSIGRVL